MRPVAQIKTFLRLFTLRAKPTDLPNSINLLIFLSVVWMLTKSALYLWYIQIIDRFDVTDIIELSYFGGMVISGVWLLVLFAVVHTALTYYHLTTRFVQTATAFVAVDCMLVLLFLVWLSGLVLLELPLESNNLGMIAIILGFILMMYWQFLVYIHILLYSMNLTILKAGVFALFYMLIQHNLSELLLNMIIKVTEV